MTVTNAMIIAGLAAYNENAPFWAKAPDTAATHAVMVKVFNAMVAAAPKPVVKLQ